MISPWLIQTFFRSFPRICASRLEPSKQRASRRPLPNILRTCAYSVCLFLWLAGLSAGGIEIDGGVEGDGRWRDERTLTLFFEGEFTLLVVVFVLSTTTILTTLLFSSCQH